MDYITTIAKWRKLEPDETIQLGDYQSNDNGNTIFKISRRATIGERVDSRVELHSWKTYWRLQESELIERS